MIRILFLGDIDGRPGREALASGLSDIVQKTKADVVIGNAENAAHGTGITKKVAAELKGLGLACLTMGDHAFDRKETPTVYDQPDIPIVRPANYPPGVPGKGIATISVGSTEIAVINLTGRVFMHEQFDDPFRTLDALLKTLTGHPIVLVDFHAEATSEKVALGWHADGRVTAVLGTHTHVQTADERILPGGTAYISDVGMNGARDGVIGVNRDTIVKRFLTQMPYPFEPEERGDLQICGVLITADPSTARATAIERVAAVLQRPNNG